MSLRKWKNEFSKKEFVKLIKDVAGKTMYYFNYTRKPFISERNLPEGTLMCFLSSGNKSMVAYDYVKFKRAFGNWDGYWQRLYAIQVMAHEMRHYYQYRQIVAKNPDEDKNTISDWKINKVIKTRGMEKTDNYKYWFSSKELDANLYAYIFAIEHFDNAMLDHIQSIEHFNAFKKLYKKNGGKNLKKFFPRRIKKQLLQM